MGQNRPHEQDREGSRKSLEKGWASVAVYLDLAVADLALALDKWRECYEDARVIWALDYKDRPVPEDKEEACLYWGYWSDLKHSGSLHVDDDIPNQPEANSRAYQERLRRAIVKGNYCLPSGFQHPNPVAVSAGGHP